MQDDSRNRITAGFRLLGRTGTAHQGMAYNLAIQNGEALLAYQQVETHGLRGASCTSSKVQHAAALQQTLDIPAER